MIPNITIWKWQSLVVLESHYAKRHLSWNYSFILDLLEFQYQTHEFLSHSAPILRHQIFLATILFSSICTRINVDYNAHRIKRINEHNRCKSWTNKIFWYVNIYSMHIFTPLISISQTITYTKWFFFWYQIYLWNCCIIAIYKQVFVV